MMGKVELIGEEEEDLKPNTWLNKGSWWDKKKERRRKTMVKNSRYMKRTDGNTKRRRREEGKTSESDKTWFNKDRGERRVWRRKRFEECWRELWWKLYHRLWKKIHIVLLVKSSSTLSNLFYIEAEETFESKCSVFRFWHSFEFL